MDHDSLNPDPDKDPAFQVNPDPDQIQGFDDQKFKKIQLNKKKIGIYLSLGLHKGRPSYWRSLLLSKATIQHFKKIFLTFF